MGEITDREVRNTKKALRVSKNLWLYPRGNSRFWIFRFMIDGRAREMGMGPYPDVSLSEARELAGENRKLLREGIDPLEHKKEKALEEKARGTSFIKVAAEYLRAHRRGWSKKQGRDWASTIRRFARPVIGEIPVGEIDTEVVLHTLSPLWLEHPALAKRLQSRLERILDYARAKGLRQGENPAAWKGHLDRLLPLPSRVRKTEHRRALDYEAVPAYLDELREKPGIAPRAIELLILTATRLEETRNASWSELDIEAAVWTIPAERTKSRREHRVPLSDAVVTLLEDLPRNGEYVFQGAKPGRPVARATLAKLLPAGATLHGFRSSFRDWTAEQTSFPERVAEHALGHAVGDATERSYRRTDLFERRRELMETWATYCSPATDRVVAINRSK